MEQDQGGSMKVAGIHHLALIVDDLEKARHFYPEIPGLQELPALAFDYPKDELFETAEGYVSGRLDGRGLRGDD
jgi:catechol 2,3-dioxygenase-like lactoylglutathione lyase family enzyme